MITKHDEQLASHAYIQALKSPCLHKHGAVASINGKIIGRGYNSYNVYSKDPSFSQACSCHAEIAALRNMFHSCCLNTYGKYSNQIKVANQ